MVRTNIDSADHYWQYFRKCPNYIQDLRVEHPIHSQNSLQKK